MSSEGEEIPPTEETKESPVLLDADKVEPETANKEDPPNTEKPTEDSKPAAAAAAVSTLPPELQERAFEDDGTFALPPGESYKIPTTPAKPPPDIEDGPTNSKGAQILMNRFSNWRQKANENANILWKQAKEAQAQAAASNQGPLAALRQVSGVTVGAGAATKTESGEEEDDDDEESSSGSGEEDEQDTGKEEGDEEDSYAEEEEKIDLDDTPSSTRSLPNLPSRQELRSKAQEAKKQAQAVATNVIGSMDTYATGFRGRYATSSIHDPNRPTGPPYSPHKIPQDSQTALILKSRAASHLQEILDSLEPYQYVLLLGAGRLQVNLKNPYVKHQGTYVDFLVQGGAADKSGVVAVGDAVVKVGNQDVRKHTIADVPSIIANAKRPVVLVLTTGVEMDVERITYLDLAVAMMHRIRAKDEQQKQEMIASAAKNKQPPIIEVEEEESEDKPGHDDMAHWEGMEDGPKEEEPEKSGPSFEDVKIPMIQTVGDYANPPQPPMTARLAYKHLVGKRCNDNFSVTQFSQFAASDDHFRAALRNAFLCCAVDGRRFPFLGRHLTMEQDAMDGNLTNQSSALQQPNKNAPNALLMLFLELINFSDLYGVTPASRRKVVAERIAYKFFLPTKVPVGAGFRLEPPMFDFHHLVPDSVLRTLEGKLGSEQEDIPLDLFLEFQHAVVDALCGTTFLLFLVSNHCARMRGYLRNSAPYCNVPLKKVFEALTATSTSDSCAVTVHAGSKNYFLYILIYLLQLEKDPTSTLTETLLGRNGHRMVGAAGGLCCYIFMGRKVIPAVVKYLKEKVKLMKEKQPESTSEEAPPTEENTSTKEASIVQVFGQLWEVFFAPGVGLLEHTWKSKETKQHLEALRARLRSIRKDVLSSAKAEGETSKQQTHHLFAEKFGSDEQLLKEIKDVADHLLYDYAIHVHSKFREHMFHEWLCNELVKARKEKSKLRDSENGKEEGAEPTSPLPELPAGCIKRLLRRVDMPKGVSPHKPIHSVSSREAAAVKGPAGNPNADCAVVFGTSVGADLFTKMQSPAMDQSDVRRYTCQDVVVQGEKLPESFEQEIIPPTLESYAVLPPTRVTGFSEVTGNVSLSSDGWEVSMVNFNIPKAGPEAEAQSLYGVSLVFQRSSTARFYPRRVSQTQLVRDAASSKVEEKKTTEGDSPATNATIDEDGKFPSPVSFNTPSDDHWSTFTRDVKVAEETPIFNGYLREKAWVDRVLQEETRDQNVPPTVGVALVSRNNVVIAMRQALVMLLRDFSRLPEDEANDRRDVITCGSLVDLLGNFAHQKVEPTALKCILEPYIRAASAPWIERPLSAQSEEFSRHAGKQLITCLPPIPLALLFISALLEQKIILSSSRRGILFSATEALTGMLKPLKYCHLIVPLVPSALAKDLVQYPAPYILGMNSEEPAVISIMNDLPMDVTLVDLDVGRVILAPELSFDGSDMSTADPTSNTTSVLRSQVLYLAQILGSHFGAKLFRDAWSCDSPSLSLRDNSKLANKEADYDILRSVCRSFIDELLAGISSSCFWIEEEPVADKKSGSTDPTVLFDEDTFFFIKRWREENGYEALLEYTERVNRSLALSMDGFNLVLECFVRCQSMNWYLSSQSKDRMAFAMEGER